MITTCIAVMLSLSLPPDNCLPVEEGWASRYSAGVMEATVEVRQNVLRDLPAYINRYDGFAATLDCSYIGKVVLARPSPTSRWHKFLIADCARRDDGDGTRSWMEENNILLELDYPTAAKWRGLAGNLPVEVVFDCDEACQRFAKHNAYRAKIPQLVFGSPYKLMHTSLLTHMGPGATMNMKAVGTANSCDFSPHPQLWRNAKRAGQPGSFCFYRTSIVTESVLATRLTIVTEAIY